MRLKGSTGLLRLSGEVMKIIGIIVGIMTIGLLSIGCNQPFTSNPTPTDIPVTTATPDENVYPNNVSWMGFPKIFVSDLSLGAEADGNITIHNGNDYTTTFLVSPKYPDNVGEGYSYPPYNFYPWVTLSSQELELRPYETATISVTLILPEKAVVPKQWEFWINVEDMNQAGMVHTATAQRWLITMQ